MFSLFSECNKEMLRKMNILLESVKDIDKRLCRLESTPMRASNALDQPTSDAAELISDTVPLLETGAFDNFETSLEEDNAFYKHVVGLVTGNLLL